MQLKIKCIGHEQLKPSIAMCLITTKILQDCYGFHRCILYVTKQNLNVEFQRIARRDTKPSSVINPEKKRKTIEWERLKMSSRKLRDAKGTFHAIWAQ